MNYRTLDVLGKIIFAGSAIMALASICLPLVITDLVVDDQNLIGSGWLATMGVLSMLMAREMEYKGGKNE